MFLGTSKEVNDKTNRKFIGQESWPRMASELPGAELSCPSNDKNRSAEISHTMSLAPHVCPSAPRCCSSHTCESIQNRCGVHPKCDSTVVRAYLPTRTPLASHHDHLDRNFHPICHPTYSNHHPQSALPICQCISYCHHVHHTSHPTCHRNSISQTNIFTNKDANVTSIYAIMHITCYEDLSLSIKYIAPSWRNCNYLKVVSVQYILNHFQKNNFVRTAGICDFRQGIGAVWLHHPLYLSPKSDIKLTVHK